MAEGREEFVALFDVGVSGGGAGRRGQCGFATTRLVRASHAARGEQANAEPEGAGERQQGEWSLG